MKLPTKSLIFGTRNVNAALLVVNFLDSISWLFGCLSVVAWQYFWTSEFNLSMESMKIYEQIGQLKRKVDRLLQFHSNNFHNLNLPVGFSLTTFFNINWCLSLQTVCTLQSLVWGNDLVPHSVLYIVSHNDLINKLFHIILVNHSQFL